MSKTITVVVPTYNRKSLLLRLLASLENQSLSREYFDLVIADDGSSDETAELLHSRGILAVRIDHRGPAAARNAGARLAVTPLLAFIDDDAVADKNWLRSIHDAFLSGQFVDATEGDVLRQGEELPLSHFVHHQGPGGFLTCNLAVRRDLFERLGGFNEAFPYPMNEDFDFFIRLKKKGSITYLPGMVVYHPVRRLPFWKTFFSSFAYARQRMVSERLLYQSAPEGYASVKAASTSRATLRRLALGYLYFYGINRPGLIFRHPFRGMLWILVCMARQLGFLLCIASS